jgi:hypothetical protein
MPNHLMSVFHEGSKFALLRRLYYNKLPSYKPVSITQTVFNRSALSNISLYFVQLILRWFTL